MILVTGATGNVGAELVRALAASGTPVRGLTRGTGPAATPPVEYVSGDLGDPASLRPALAGVRGLFLLPGYPAMPEILAEAARAGVEHVVLLSGSSAASGDTRNAITRYMVESERAVRDSGLAWTVLRPSGFMSNTLEWVPQLASGDVVRAPFAGVPIATIDPYDIAAVAAGALSGDGHRGQVYRLTGPEALRPADRLRTLGTVLGRDLRLDAQSDEDARAEMLATVPADYVDAFFDFYVTGSLDDSTVLPTVRELTGRPARTFAQWAEAHAAAFR
ncbi:NAD(P)H-binding protein [Actinocatenispora rupis]|uniref:Nucleotide-diphosphate-sugar epimerase n=1 Tax=Actinocatenispora rupis TaxID=519421 RepID=A0A8J3IWD6_9ACTN|nr:NAD(P)H-binding protein [Actinocatenispora rupis]GID09878.1 nucleotide-diphosphate-sugar epimerase [Actinocatenispora rupis]